MDTFSMPPGIDATLAQSSTELVRAHAASEGNATAVFNDDVNTARRLLNEGKASEALLKLQTLNEKLQSGIEVPAVLRAQLRFLLGRAFDAAGERQKAHEELTQAEQLLRDALGEDSSPRCLLDHGYCLALLGRPDEAISSIKRVAEDKELGSEAARLLGSILEDGKQFGEAAMYFDRADAFADALRAYTAALEHETPSATLYARRARILLLLKRTQESLEDTTRALALDNPPLLAWQIRAIDLVVLGQAREALAVLDEAARKGGETKDTLLVRANALFLLNRLNEAAEIAHQCVVAAPRFGAALVFLARIYANKEEPQQAIPYAKQAVELQPENADAQAVLGVLLTQVKDSDTAKIHLRKAIQLDPQSTALIPYLDLLTDEHQYRDALSLMEDALRRQPGNGELRGRHIFCLQRLGREQEAAQEARKVLAEHPRDPWLLVRAATALSQSGAPKDAIEPLQTALNLSPEYDEARFQLGEALRRLGRIEEAARELSHAMQRMPGDARVIGTMGQIELARGNVSGAISLLKQALEMDRSLGWAWSDLADAEQTASNLDGALSAIDRALLLNPNSTAYRQKKGWLLIQDGQPDAAAKEFAIAVERDKGSPSAWCNWGEALRRAGHWSAARKPLDEAVRLNPNDLDIIANKGLLLCDIAEYSGAIELIRPYSEKGMRHGWANCVLGWGYENGSNSVASSDEKEYAQKALLAYEAGLPDSVDAAAPFSELDLWNWKGKANALRLLGRIDDANAAYRKVLDLAKQHPVRVSADIHALLGWCEYGVCNFVEAVRLLQSAVSLDPALLGAAFDLGLALFCCSQRALAVERYTHAVGGVEAKEIEGRRGFLYVAWFDLQEAIQDSRMEAVNENVPEVKQVMANLRASLKTAFSGTNSSFATAL